ncbi:MAG: HEAT repeat domain-containing protein [Spirochaetaceae bacterium]|jgi:HEAT repeat protein|nr:HEAT repeat domain-containing protein [Spirochaetaceae bacterium]
MRFFAWIFAVLVFLGVSAFPAAAQEKELSVEESYLQESVAVSLIREQARSEDRDGKLLALDYIKEYMDDGNKTDDVRAVLESLSLEGNLNKTRSEGRVMNNFPDIRIRALEYLGELGTKEATDSLIKVMFVDDEPAVLTQAVRSITKIGINDQGRPLTIINWIFSRFNAAAPDNRLALAFVDAVEAFASSTDGDQEEKLARASALETVRNISANHLYISAVRQRARNVMMKFYKNGADGNSGK